MSRYPMPALWIDTTPASRICIRPVTVESVFRLKRDGGDVHMAVFTTLTKFSQRLTRPLAELATTPEKILEKLPELLTALESRPPLTNEAGKTDSGADNLQPSTA